MNRIATSLVVLCVMLLWIGAILLHLYSSREIVIFDALNVLFTGLAVVGVLFTVNLQREDIKSQNENSKVQNFENVLFKAIDYQKELLKDLPFTLSNEYFTSYTELLKTNVHQGVKDGNRESFESNYDRCYYKYLDGLEPYFKSLDVILELIQKSQLSEEQKDFYFKLVNTLQSREQKITLQYHASLYVQRDSSERLKHMLYKGEFICLNGDHAEVFTDADKYFEERRM